MANFGVPGTGDAGAGTGGGVNTQCPPPPESGLNKRPREPGGDIKREDAADQKRMKTAQCADPQCRIPGSESAQSTDETKPTGSPSLSSLRRRKRPHRITGNGKCHRIPSILAKTSTPWRQNARHGQGHARTRRDRTRRQEPLQPRTSKEQLTESGKGSDQDHDPGATQLQAGCAGSGFADIRIRRQLERLIVAAKNILEARAQLAELQNQNNSVQLNQGIQPATSILAEGGRSLVLSRETDSKSGKTAEEEKVRQLLQHLELLPQAAVSIAKSVAQAYALEQEQSAWESFRIDKAVGEAQESDEDASKSRAATPDKKKPTIEATEERESPTPDTTQDGVSTRRPDESMPATGDTKAGNVDEATTANDFLEPWATAIRVLARSADTLNASRRRIPDPKMAVQALLNLARQDRKEREKKRAVEPPAPLTMEKTTEKEKACSATGYVCSGCGAGSFSGTGASSCTACGRLCRCSNCKEEERKAIRAIDTAAEQEEDTEWMGDRTDDGQMTEQEENLQALRVLDTAADLLQKAELHARLQGEAERELSVLQCAISGEATQCQSGTDWEEILHEALVVAEFKGEEAKMGVWLASYKVTYDEPLRDH